LTHLARCEGIIAGPLRAFYDPL